MLRNCKLQLASCNLSRSFASGPRRRRRPLYHVPSCLPIASAEEVEGTIIDQPPHQFQILYQDDDIVAIEKPAGGVGKGFFVHPPEDGYPIPASENCLRLLKEQLGGTYLYPVHRLDRATSGVVLYGLSSSAARRLCYAFEQRQIHKTYIALARGYTFSGGCLDMPLANLPSRTFFRTLHRAELLLPQPFNKFPTARVSLLAVSPESGRLHQIRRHLSRISHPIIGDGEHGGRPLNRMYRDMLHMPGMYLKAASITLPHPDTGLPLQISSTAWEDTWTNLFDTLGVSVSLDPAHLAAYQQMMDDDKTDLDYSRARQLQDESGTGSREDDTDGGSSGATTAAPAVSVGRVFSKEVAGGGGGVVTVIDGGERGYRGSFEDVCLPGLLGGSRFVEAVPQRMKVKIPAVVVAPEALSSPVEVASEAAAVAGRPVC